MGALANVDSGDSKLAVLLVRAQNWHCALPISAVSETCRPLEVKALDGTPSYVRGMFVLRGLSTPVLHLGALLSGEVSQAGTRYVALRVAGRPLVLEVDEVMGVRHFTKEQLSSTKSLLGSGILDKIGDAHVVEGALVAFLDSARLVQDEHLDLLVAEGWG